MDPHNITPADKIGTALALLLLPTAICFVSVMAITGIAWWTGLLS